MDACNCGLLLCDFAWFGVYRLPHCAVGALGLLHKNPDYNRSGYGVPNGAPYLFSRLVILSNAKNPVQNLTGSFMLRIQDDECEKLSLSNWIVLKLFRVEES